MKSNRFRDIVLIIICLFCKQTTFGQAASLIEAVRNDREDEVKKWIARGADVNAVDEDGDNALINAVVYSSTHCLPLLLEAKADPNLANKFGHTALMLSTDNIGNMALLVKYGAHVNDTSRSGNSALLLACSGYGKYESVKWLIDHGANLSAKRWSTETAIMRAAQFSDTLTIGLLLEKGFDINAHPWGYTPVMYALRMGNWAAIPFLVHHGADVNILDDDNNPPVVWAAIANKIETINVMLPKTKDLNTVSERTGMSPLMWAVYSEYDNHQVVQQFIDRGADINFRSKDGSTALSWAMKKGNTKTVALLKQLGAKK